MLDQRPGIALYRLAQKARRLAKVPIRLRLRRDAKAEGSGYGVVDDKLFQRVSQGCGRSRQLIQPHPVRTRIGPWGVLVIDCA